MTIDQIPNQNTATNQIIKAAKAIRIVSGEGEIGTSETYTGTRTTRALKARLTRERQGGQRIARAEYVRTTTIDGDDVYDTLAL